jgi:RNA polymerase sigma factor (sigma-70 family)
MDTAPVPGEILSEAPDGWSTMVRRIRQGNSHAEAEMAQYFFDRVRVMAEARMHGSEIAQDVAQETILAVLEAIRAGKLREPEKLPAFVLGTARNLVNNHFRHEAAAREFQANPPARTVADPVSGAAIDAQRRDLIKDALKQLKPLDQRILLLTLAEGMNPREIAPVVGLKAEAVRTRKARAVRAIHEKLKKMTRKP